MPTSQAGRLVAGCSRILLFAVATGVLAMTSAEAALKPVAPRQSLSLDGTWEIEQGGLDAPPAEFMHTIPVPGLADMATPAFTEVGKVSKQREAFWYRRTFRVDQPIPEIALLKLHKARYGSQVWLNGKLLGEHPPSFTPVEFDARALLQPGENVVLVRLGAHRESLPLDQISGYDFEKILYTPGIYDSVELIFSGAPYLRNVQTVPDPIAKTVRVVVEVVAGAQPAEFMLRSEVVADKTKTPAGAAVSEKIPLAANELKTLDFVIPLKDGHVWTPEDPFLYELRLSTGADAGRERFGLRSFRFDAVTKRAMLNEKPYFLRGSNITLDRFYEDSERGSLPWNAAWVRKLHQQVKAMNWNSLRYCIGFPPEFWYDIADEEGILIQDEFPFWIGSKKADNKISYPRAEKVIPEYTGWMRERWNHPCVVIWDAQNETTANESGKARDAVRHLDLSNRPWDNGWAAPGLPTDMLESHPYLFSRAWVGRKKNPPDKPFSLSEMATVKSKPWLPGALAKFPNPIVINEYDWLWINRAGEPTVLTGEAYDFLLGPNATSEQRRFLRARYVAALTEFWRCHQKEGGIAGLMHFCCLGYSRSAKENGATSDDWADVRELRYEPHFAEYVKEAFAPAGLMLDFWAESLAPGEKRELPILTVNDLSAAWAGQLRLRVLRANEVVSEQTQDATIPGYGDGRFTFAFTAPTAPGDYTLEAALVVPGQPATRSLRDFKIKTIEPSP